MQLQNHILEIERQNSFQDEGSQNSQQNIMQSQFPSQLQNQQKYQYSCSQQNWNSPLSQFSNSFSVFNEKRKPTDLSTFIKIKSHHQYLQIFSQFKSYMQIKSVNFNQTTPYQITSDNSKQAFNPDQFFYTSEMPENCTFVVIIKPLSKGRCNIEVYNLSGFVIAYYNSIKICKKFPKIYKLILKFVKPCLLIIIDQIATNQFQYSYLKKISQLCENYLYIINKFTENQLKLGSQLIHPNQLVQIYQNQIIKRVNEKLYYFSKVFAQDNAELLLKVDFLVQGLENSKKQIFYQLNIEKSQEERILSFDSLIINTAKLYVYKSDDIANKILQIFEMNQQKIVDGNEQIKFGQQGWHMPEAMKQCRDCLYCSKFKNQSKKKTKYRCQGCSATQHRQIPLCVVCFKKFHINEKVKKSLLRFMEGKSKKIKKENANKKDLPAQTMKFKKNQMTKQSKKPNSDMESMHIQKSHDQIHPSYELKKDIQKDRITLQVSNYNNQNQIAFQKQKQKFQYLNELKELEQIKSSIFEEIEKLRQDQKYEIAKKSLQIFISKLMTASIQLEEKIKSLRNQM